jgi:hypothetical protein
LPTRSSLLLKRAGFSNFVRNSKKGLSPELLAGAVWMTLFEPGIARVTLWHQEKRTVLVKHMLAGYTPHINATLAG